MPKEMEIKDQALTDIPVEQTVQQHRERQLGSTIAQRVKATKGQECNVRLAGKQHCRLAKHIPETTAIYPLLFLVILFPWTEKSSRRFRKVISCGNDFGVLSTDNCNNRLAIRKDEVERRRIALAANRMAYYIMAIKSATAKAYGVHPTASWALVCLLPLRYPPYRSVTVMCVHGMQVLFVVCTRVKLTFWRAKSPFKAVFGDRLRHFALWT